MVALGLQRIRVGPLLKSHRSSIWPRFESIWPQKKRDREGRDPCDPRWPSGRPRRLSSRRPVLLLAAADLRPSLHPAASALPRSVLASYAPTGSRSLPRVDPPPSRSPRCRLLLTPLLAAGTSRGRRPRGGEHPRLMTLLLAMWIYPAPLWIHCSGSYRVSCCIWNCVFDPYGDACGVGFGLDWTYPLWLLDQPSCRLI
jgi:hypothetical protein